MYNEITIYNSLEIVFLQVLNRAQNILRANNVLCMTKVLRKTFMERSNYKKRIFPGTNCCK